LIHNKRLVAIAEKAARTALSGTSVQNDDDGYVILCFYLFAIWF